MAICPSISTEAVYFSDTSFPVVYQMELMTDNTAKTVSFYRSAGFVRADDMGCCAFMKM